MASAPPSYSGSSSHSGHSGSSGSSGQTGRRVTVRDIAAETGVSIATVSRVLNGHARVAPETRELVQRAADRLGAQSGAGASRTSQGAIYLRCPYTLSDFVK